MFYVPYSIIHAIKTHQSPKFLLIIIYSFENIIINFCSKFLLASRPPSATHSNKYVCWFSVHAWITKPNGNRAIVQTKETSRSEMNVEFCYARNKFIILMQKEKRERESFCCTLYIYQFKDPNIREPSRSYRLSTHLPIEWIQIQFEIMMKHSSFKIKMQSARRFWRGWEGKE